MSARNIEAFFSPKSIALIGASHRPHAVGSVIARNLGGNISHEAEDPTVAEAA